MPNEKESLCNFIEAYKSFPCLWKVKSKGYSDRNAKTQAYEALIEKLQPLDPEANRESVVKKINSLRTAYRKELKKVINSEKSGAGEDDIYIPHLWYFELLHFLKDQEVARNTQSNIEDMVVSDHDAPYELTESPNVSLPPTPTPYSSAPDTPASCTSQTSQTSGQLSKASRGRKNKCDEVLDVIGKRLAQPSVTATDKFSDIGKAWASKLRDLDPHQAVHAEKIINDVFYEAQLGNLNRNCFLQIQQEYTRNTQPSFNILAPVNTHQSYHTQPPWNTLAPVNTHQSYHTELSFNTPPPVNTQILSHTQPSRYTSNMEPKEKPMPPENSTAGEYLRVFRD